MTPVARLLATLPDAKQTSKGWSARCPAHEDRRASLSVGEGDDGRALVHCHAGCTAEAVCAAVGLRLADLMPESDKPKAKANGKPRIVATYSYTDETGKTLFQVVRFHPKDFRQRRPKPGGGWTWSVRGVRVVPYGLMHLTAEPTRPVVVVEGEKDVHNLARIDVLATCNAGGAGKWTADHAEFLRGRHVTILPDNDEPGRKHAQQVAQSLHGIAASVRIVELPDLAPKGDVSDWIASGGTKEELKRLVKAAPAWTPTAAEAPPSKPQIVVSTDERPTVDAAIAALAKDDSVFQRGGVLVSVLRDDGRPSSIVRAPGAPRISMLAAATVRERLASAATWYILVEAEGGPEKKIVHPPQWAINAVAARGYWPGIRHLEGVIEEPILRCDGSILDTPGYDAATGLLFEPRGEFPAVPSHPTAAEIGAARDLLAEVVCDFPFAGVEHRSGWLAGLLTPLARFAFAGPAPMFAFDASTRGSGKSLLADAIGLIVSGRKMARMSVPDSDDEMRKRITSLVIEGDRLVLLDNAAGVVGCPSLDAALTATTWKDRLLGTNKTTAELPLSMVWYVTGNNIAFNGDTTRRVVYVRLQPEHERPEERSGFRHPDLLAWIGRERGRLVSAALAILRGYCAAGRPDQHLTPWGSFGGWSALVRGAIVWAGMPDPAIARDELARQGDRDAQALAALLSAWEEIDSDGTGLTAAEALRLVESGAACAATLRDVLPEVCPPAKGAKLPSAAKVGYLLRRLRGRVCAGKRFVSGQNRNGVAIWGVQAIENRKIAAGDAGDAGDVLCPSLRGGGVLSVPDKEKTDSGPTENIPRIPRIPRTGTDNERVQVTL